MRTLFATILVFVLFIPNRGWPVDFTLWGRDFSFAVTETFSYGYHLDNGNQDKSDDDFHQVLNVLDLGLSHGDFRLGTRLDMLLFAHTPFAQYCHGSNQPGWCNQKDERYVNSIVPERLFLMVAHPEYDIVLGDFYASFGKGLALNVIKIDELGQDTTIRGGKLMWHDKDLEVTFLGGEFNPLNTDEATGRKILWRAEPILGGRLEYRFWDALIAGIHGVYIITDDQNNLGKASSAAVDSNTVFGGGLELPSVWHDHLSFAAEVDVQRTISLGEVTRGPGATGEGFSGLAGYVASTFHWNRWTILGEYKHYDDFQLKAPNYTNQPYALLYHQPPTLERVNAELTDNTKISGGRLRVDYNIGTWQSLEVLVFANFSYFKDWAGGENSDRRIYDPFGGLELQWQEGNGHLNLSAGVRRDVDHETGTVNHQDIHLDGDLEQQLYARHSLKLSLQFLERHREEQFRTDTWKEMEVILGYKWSPWLALAINFERQEDPKIVMERESQGLWLGPANYLGGSAQYFLQSDTYVSLRVGQNRPGIKCINGVCRTFPAFAGIQINLVGRF